MSTEKVDIIITPERMAKYKAMKPLDGHEMWAEVNTAFVGNPGIDTVPEHLHGLALKLCDGGAKEDRIKLRQGLAAAGCPGGYVWGDVAVFIKWKKVPGRGAMPDTKNMRIGRLKELAMSVDGR
jgi:hypothetical protein